MTAKQIMDFMDSHSSDTSMFNELEQAITDERMEIAIKLESSPHDKKLLRQYANYCEKLRAIHIMRSQRLELFKQAGY